jgi:hypothetical protein
MRPSSVRLPWLTTRLYYHLQQKPPGQLLQPDFQRRRDGLATTTAGLLFVSQASMTYPHIIRLRNPWQNNADQNPTRYCRSFHCPTGLEAHEQVWLVVENPDRVERVVLNARPLGEAPWDTKSCGFDVTAILTARNTIEIDVAGQVIGQTVTDVFGPVRLEIRLGPAVT